MPRTWPHHVQTLMLTSRPMEKESNVSHGTNSAAPGEATIAPKASGLGLIGFDSFHFVVENLERSRHFYTDVLDFKEVARAGNDLVARSGQQSIVFGAGDARVCVSTPLAQKSKAARY